MRHVKNQKITFFLLFLLFLIGSQLILVHSKNQNLLQEKREKVLYMPSGKYLKAASIGYEQMLADFIWVKTISYFGVHALTDRDYAYLPNLLEAVTTLDPYWYFPYHFAGVVLSVEANYAEKANEILRKGMVIYPEKWQIPFYIGFNYFHVLNDSNCGSKYIYKASVIEGSPGYLKPLAVRLSAKGNTKENHVEMCRKLLSITSQKDIREKIIERCKERITESSENKQNNAEVCR